MKTKSNIRYIRDHNGGKNYDIIETDKNGIGVIFRAYFHWQDKLAGSEFCCLSK